MRYLVTFRDEWRAQGQSVNVCIIEARNEGAALGVARTACQWQGEAQVLLLPERLALDPGIVNRRLERNEASEIFDDLAQQIIRLRADRR